MLTISQLKALEKMRKAIKKESKNFKSPRRREKVSQGLKTVDFILRYEYRRRKHPSAKIPVRVRVEKIIEKSPGIEQPDILRELRARIKRYRETPNFAAYFANVMRRVRSKPPAWMGFEKYLTKWTYWNEKRYPGIGTSEQGKSRDRKDW